MRVVLEVEEVVVAIKLVALPMRSACGHQGSHVLWVVQQMLQVVVECLVQHHWLAYDEIL
jgi:N6-adenosine-specific RNA methylase IME4